MSEHEQLEDGIAISQQQTRRQIQTAGFMFLSSAAAYLVTLGLTRGMVGQGIDGLALAMAAATGLTVGVGCLPSAYRLRNGSLILAIGLLAFLWSVPLLTIVLWYLG